MAINEAYNVDCIEYMRTLPDEYFDLAVCDPPYGSGNDTKLGGQKVRRNIRSVLQTGTDSKADGRRSITALRNWGGAERFGERFGRYFKPEQISRRNVGDKIPCSNGGGVLN